MTAFLVTWAVAGGCGFVACGFCALMAYVLEPEGSTIPRGLARAALFFLLLPITLAAGVVWALVRIITLATLKESK